MGEHVYRAGDKFTLFRKVNVLSVDVFNHRLISNGTGCLAYTVNVY